MRHLRNRVSRSAATTTAATPGAASSSTSAATSSATASAAAGSGSTAAAPTGSTAASAATLQKKSNHKKSKNGCAFFHRFGPICRRRKPKKRVNMFLAGDSQATVGWRVSAQSCWIFLRMASRNGELAFELGEVQTKRPDQRRPGCLSSSPWKYVPRNWKIETARYSFSKKSQAEHEI